MQKDSIILSINAFINKYPKLTRFLANYVDHFYEDYSSYKLFLQKNRAKSHKLNLGSGAAPVENNFRNVDYYSLRGVSLRADVHQLPFKRSSINTV